MGASLGVTEGFRQHPEALTACDLPANVGAVRRSDLHQLIG
jgi:hypothetical protein